LRRRPPESRGAQRLRRRHALPQITSLSIREAEVFFQKMKLPGHKGEIADKILKEICARLGFLNNVGLDYLTLARKPKLCPAAKRSVFAWLRRSVRAWSA
jgi:excinuclease UvrABC ATPase subunit